MPTLRRAIALCAAAASIFAAGCGGEERSIPRDEAGELLDPIESARSALASGSCSEVVSAAERFADEARTLPPDVGDEVREALVRAAERLLELAHQPGQCESGEGIEAPSELAPEADPAEGAPEAPAEEPPADRGDGSDRQGRPEGDRQGGDGGAGGRGEGGGSGGDSTADEEPPADDPTSPGGLPGDDSGGTGTPGLDG